jgi:iron complex outermembrane receptor protein
MYNKKILLFIAFFFAIFECHAQNCKLSIKGDVFDETTELPLSYVNVFIQETSLGTLTDDKGSFLLDSICVGKYDLIFSRIGYESKKIQIDFVRDTILNIRLSNTITSLDEVVVEGKKNDFNNQANLSINRETIEDNSNQNLSGLLENETGVHLIKNGSGISKPIVHGLYGNRLTILNNGIAQSGQQWGNDHSPEIDPYSADKITVLKGANAIEYGGGNLGSVILVEPKKIERKPHLHGQASYAFETNGRGHSLNTRLEKYSPLLAWRINGTLKKSGDKKTADYFLNNTGTEEANFSIQLEKSWKSKLFFDFYASTFNTRLGILRGSHIGNLTDLEQALTSQVPFFTEPDFSYKIDAPRQQVSHHLVKSKAKYFIKENKIIELVVAAQINNRKEFDVRRGGRTDIPTLSLAQYTFNSEFKYTNNFGEDWNFKLGNQTIVTDNTNNPETGILPLIPDYISWKNGLFSTLSKNKNKIQFSIGIRYDYEYQNAITISNSLPREIIRYKNQYHNVSGLSTIKLDIAKSQSISFNTGYAMRNPAINELYSNGLHQGVSGIEEGDINLKTENAFKNIVEYKWFPSTHFSIHALAYYQHFKNYIFLNPQDEIRLTIRGAFPVFRYEQTDANIYGLDISMKYDIGNSLFGMLKYSYLRGDDTRNNTPLVFMPPNRFFGSLSYRAKKIIKLSKNVSMEKSEIEINNKLVLEQNNILSEQDFVKPPPIYNLLGLKISSNIIFSNYKIRCFAKADNLFNTRYRDYLNRQRYFADDTGLSVTIGVNFKF